MATQRGNEEHMSLYRIRVHRTVSDKNRPVPSKVDAARLCKILSDKSRPMPSEVDTARLCKNPVGRERACALIGQFFDYSGHTCML